ncbi:MAG: hypothetical protein HXX08_16895 [Chloroflexi bacterium]|uniref:Uncharacterized protein n=1 Tax=Candidatus Chlorohelix allophototropha TaxID=3003348 RepID=A0A8T7M606_9CHLR|nr:hypothetical protein [Chloroflexota bacterium]WJW69449.1 hypothetical protein OZ401_003061 [Chloroflexota bacterium L227-S17]
MFSSQISRRRTTLQMGLAVLLMLGMIFYSLGAFTAHAASNASTGLEGSVFTLKGSGFTPFEKVDLWTTDPSGAALSASYVLADQTGSFLIKAQTSDPDGLAQALGGNYTRLFTDFDVNGVVVDTYLQLILFKPSVGTWSVTGHGELSSVQQVMNFQVLGGEKSSSTIIATPATGALGTIFTMKGSGYGAGERVSLWTTDPKNAALDASYITADDNGNIQVRVQTTDPEGLAQTFGGNYTRLITEYDTSGNAVDTYLLVILYKPSVGNWSLSTMGNLTGTSQIFGFATTAD